jgi:hypothetical protein
LVLASLRPAPGSAAHHAAGVDGVTQRCIAVDAGGPRLRTVVKPTAGHREPTVRRQHPLVGDSTIASSISGMSNPLYRLVISVSDGIVTVRNGARGYRSAGQRWRCQGR